MTPDERPPTSNLTVDIATMNSLTKLAVRVLVGICFSSVVLAVPGASPDQGFYTEAAIAGMAEVEAGKLAQARGTTQEVRDFGALMASDHTRANEMLKSLAAGKRITLPTELDAKSKAMLRELETASGAAFDAAYLRGQVVAHQDTEALLKQEVMSGEDGDAQAWASAMLPIVQAHLKRVRALAHAIPGGHGEQ